jgi:hypothetical protein
MRAILIGYSRRASSTTGATHGVHVVIVFDRRLLAPNERGCLALDAPQTRRLVRTARRCRQLAQPENSPGAGVDVDSPLRLGSVFAGHPHGATVCIQNGR